jgi:hypothetical protein
MRVCVVCYGVRCKGVALCGLPRKVQRKDGKTHDFLEGFGPSAV